MCYIQVKNIRLNSFYEEKKKIKLCLTKQLLNMFKLWCEWGISLKLHWFADLMNVTEEVKIHRPNVSTLLSSAFIRGDLNAATRDPFM